MLFSEAYLTFTNRGHQQQDQTSDKAKLWIQKHRFNAEYDIPDMFRPEDTTSEQA